MIAEFPKFEEGDRYLEDFSVFRANRYLCYVYEYSMHRQLTPH